MPVKENEEKIAKFWQENRIFEKSVEQRDEDKLYVFYDGPPFATGLPHYGHILGLTSKDLFPRFWTMKGYKVERRWGWDCHGLPIENIAEKELGIKEKKGIEEFGIDKFNEFCRSKVLFFANEWKKTVFRLGKWIEFDNSYKTMDQGYMETVWYLLKNLYDKEFIYEGKKILLYCPRCETPLSNAEIAMDNSYKEVSEKTAIAKFKVKGEDYFLLAWTTTPWTLVGNVALAVNPNLTYVKIEVEGEKAVLAKERLSEVKDSYIVLEEFKGEKLVGKEYEKLYDIETDKKGFYVIDGKDNVSSEEGTGIVHMAIYGEFDFEMIKKYDLPVIQHVGKDGKIVLGPEKFLGLWFKKIDALVLKDLEERNLIFKEEMHAHSYPFCYRCETPLFYNAVNSWFIDIQKIKKRLIEKNSGINWYPENISEGRFGYILETAPDWSISRNRYWATALPIWKCDDEKCKNLEFLGSVKELQEKAVEKIQDDIDLHKHVLDKIHLKCKKCNGKMSRIPEVIDCWFESSAMPYAERHYPFENEEKFKKCFPADFVSEYVGQVRAWFYYMHVIGVLLFDKPPFKNVVVSGNILAADGSKMSKSKKNFPDPNLMFDKYGADALRFYLMSSNLMKAQDLNFKEENLNDIFRKTTMLLENIKKFYEMFSTKRVNFEYKKSNNVLDRWIVSKLNVLEKNVTEALEKYDTVKACDEILDFIGVLSTWYIRRSRDRFKGEESERQEASDTLGYALYNLSKVIAPISPFVSEDLYQHFRSRNKELKESVHLDSWPEFDEDLIDLALEEKMKTVREIVSLALEERENAKIPIRQVLSKLTVFNAELEDELAELIKEEVNVKNVEFSMQKSDSKEIIVKLDTELNEELILEGLSRELIRNINSFRKELNLTIRDSITLYIDCEDEEIKKSANAFEESIKKAVQAVEMKISAFGPDAKSKELEINKRKIKIGIKTKD